jgi:hypothetical protein
MTDLQLLKQQIENLELSLTEARLEEPRDWNLINGIIDELSLLEGDCDAIVRAERYAEEAQAITDFWDDDKNRDAYTMAIIDMQFSDVVKN